MVDTLGKSLSQVEEVQTSNHLLTLCLFSPGRFFAAQQLKLVLAHIAMNYEIRPIDTRPPNRWFAGSAGPPLEATIMIRRREGTA